LYVTSVSGLDGAEPVGEADRHEDLGLVVGAQGDGDVAPKGREPVRMSTATSKMAPGSPG